MNIIIVGGGKIGVTILQSLVREHHNVVMVDSDPQVIQQLSNNHDVMCVCGNGVDWETLTEAGATKANLLIAVTGSDEFNMLCCFMAKKLGVENTVARIRKPEYNDQSLGLMRHHLDISMVVNPDAIAAKELFHLLQLPGAAMVETFSRRNFEMVEVVLKPGCALDGVTLQEMKKKYPAAYLVGTVQRNDTAHIPSGLFQLMAGDRIGLTGTASEIEKLLRQLGMMQERAKNVMIIGASRTAFYLTKMLLESGSRVTVIDKNKALCEEFSEGLPEALIVCGDAAQEELLAEEGLDAADAFVSLTGIDEQNILLSYLASGHGTKKVITKINRDEFTQMAGKLGLDSILSPRKLTGDVLTRYARALENSMGSSVKTMYKLMGGKAEALEFAVSSDFPALNTELRDLRLKRSTLIAGIIRGRKVMIPTGSDRILAGDSVVVLTAESGVTDLTDILE